MASTELILFAGLFAASISVYSLVSFLVTNNLDSNVLSWANGQEQIKSKSELINLTRPFVHQFTLKYAIKVKDTKYRAQIQKLLLTSGLSRELKVDEFLGLQMLWAFLLPMILGVLEVALQAGIPWPIFLMLVPVGYKFPVIYANTQRKQREISVRADLPFFADILALATASSGVTFPAALQKIVERADDSVLAEEFALVLEQMSKGATLAESMKNMASRLDLQEISSFVAVIVDAEAMGQPFGPVLQDQSKQIRLERFARAEKAGARASQLMLVPMMIFIMPAVFIVVLGPVLLGFGGGGSP